MKTAAKLLTLCVAVGLMNSAQLAFANARAINVALAALGQNFPGNQPPANFPFSAQPDERVPERLPTAVDPSSARNSAFNERAVTNPYNIESDGGQDPRAAGGPANATKKSQASALLRNARVELARRNPRAAADYVSQAKQVGAIFNLLDDSPTKVETLLQKFNQFESGPKPGEQSSFSRLYAQFLMEQADGLILYNDFPRAEAMALEAKNLRAEFRQFERTPDQLLSQIADMKRPSRDNQNIAANGASAVRQAGFVENNQPYPVRQSGFDPGQDRTRNVPAAFAGPEHAEADGRKLYEQGLRALEQRERDAAIDLFRQAWKYRDQLDPRGQQDLQDKLNLLQPARNEPIPQVRPNPLDGITAEQQIALQKLQREVFSEREAAERMLERDPRAALNRLQSLRDRIAQSTVDAAAKKQWMLVVDNSIRSTEQYIEQNIARIESDALNQNRLQDVENRRRGSIDTQNEIALLVDQFNKLMNEHRYYEAKVIARQAFELAPEEPVVQNIKWKAEFAVNLHENQLIRDRGQSELVGALISVDEAGMPFDDRDPYRFPDATTWRQLSETRAQRERHGRSLMTPEEMRIHQAIRDQKVDVRFTKHPLKDVLDYLGEQAGVNMHVDQQGLIAEGVTSDTPVTINLNQPISLRSALNLILSDLNLGYVVQNEVVKITSESLKDRDVYQKTYYVADLVIPIPNFVPSYNIGLPGALAAAHLAATGGGSMPASGTVPLTLAANPDATLGTNPEVLANVGRGGAYGSQNDIPRPVGFTPGGLGGGPIADFDSLIELITTTIAPETWDEVGGPGSVSGFETNLSLVVSQTQEVHEQLGDLLEQLRRLQDLQVTIEVRFIRLNDDFFERIGVDFDFDIDDNSGFVGNPDPAIPFTGNFPADDSGPSITIGVDQTGNPTADLDLQFSQNSFASAVPAFGGFDANTAATFGFAILSDIEAFFFITAAQGDNRNNVLQAPKVTLFNGQSAVVSDTVQQPFVTSIIPVVGDFAAAQQPVVVVLSEGTSLSVQAVVSSDRRFVRLTMVPFFSKIGRVREFTFDGKTTTRTGDFVQDAGAGGDDVDFERIVEGTTVQLPEFAFTTVTTTVSVPDGGTVLLGGIKTLRENRNEVGVPLLSKLPYINRLFNNVGIGRETESLMMMVTPRIIIQEEEEERAVGRVLN